MNIVTKSGTKKFHGRLWDFIRNDDFQARNFFDINSHFFPCDKSDSNASTREACAPPFNQNQFGGPWRPVCGADVLLHQPRRIPPAARRRNLHPGPYRCAADGDFSATLLAATAGTDALGRSVRRGQLFDPRTFASGDRLDRTPAVCPRPVHEQPDSVESLRPGCRQVSSRPSLFLLPNGEVNANGDVLENWLDSRSSKTDNEQFSGRIDHQFSETDTMFGRFTFQDSATTIRVRSPDSARRIIFAI